MPVEHSRFEAEKEELNWLLTSGVLGRSSNLTRMLEFVCEKHFLGQDEHVKEYTIATEALGRRDNFDPQIGYHRQGNRPFSSQAPGGDLPDGRGESAGQRSDPAWPLHTILCPFGCGPIPGRA